MVAPIWTPDWILSAPSGGGAIATRAARALLKAVEVADGVPLLVVGHSTGGVVARILTAPEPYEGRRVRGGQIAQWSSASVRSCSPHVNAMEAYPTRWKGSGSATFAEAHVPGAFWAPRVGYLAVASCWIVGYEEGVEQDAGQRTARRFYEQVLPAATPGGDRRRRRHPGPGRPPAGRAAHRAR